MEKLLSELLSIVPELHDVDPVSVAPNVLITSITNDSREVVSGCLFLAFPGEQMDGRHFIAQAIERGAAAIFYEIEPDANYKACTVPMIPVENLRQKQAAIAVRFYGNPSASLPVIGVTGTNGKTSCTYYLAQILGAKQRCGVIGTTGYGFLGAMKKGLNTTPDPTRLQKMLLGLKDQKASVVAMEVSSHGLVENRLAGIHYDTAVFTNLSEEHLDFHGTMEAYKEAKALLFQWPGLKNAVINADDAVGREFIQRYKNRYNVLSYSRYAEADIYLKKCMPEMHGFSVTIQTPWGEGKTFIPLLGEFNLSNVLAVIGVLGLLGLPLEDIFKGLPALSSPPGRMKVFRQSNKPTAVVDFAHTPDALEGALKALRAQCFGQLWCVFGCGGNRDVVKRPLMGAIAEKYADHVVITNDNPRTELPEIIAEHICEGIQHKEKMQIVLDRERAIQMAMSNASVNDLILIAGKGHETEQIIGEQLIPFDDGAIVEACLKKLSQDPTVV